MADVEVVQLLGEALVVAFLIDDHGFLGAGLVVGEEFAFRHVLVDDHGGAVQRVLWKLVSRFKIGLR